MEGVQVSAASFPAQQFAQSFFRELPTDSRYLQYSFQQFSPSTSIEADTIVFDLNRFEAANLYMLNEACVEVRIKITKANGTKPDADKKVWPVNNILHSLFSIVRVLINDQPVVKQPDHYPFKAYIGTLLTYSLETKNAQLQAQGYFSDLGNHFSNTDDDYSVNVGAQERLKYLN